MNSNPPIPIRPLCRTRRRSSSLSAISECLSSPDLSSSATLQWTAHRSHSKTGGGKRLKRTKTCATRAGPSSPLKQASQSLSASPDDQACPLAWTEPSPFAVPSQPSLFALPARASADGAIASAGAFTSSATDFALPATAATMMRSRNGSSDSSSTPDQLSFDDSSVSSTPTTDSPSTSPPNYSLASASTSLHSPSSSLLFSSAAFRTRTASAPASTPTSLDSSTPIPPVPTVDPSTFDEAARLHHIAFEQLRSATREEEEGFVERMRRWEREREARRELFGDDDNVVMESEDVARESSDEEDDRETEDEEDDDLEVQLEFLSPRLGDGSQAHLPPVSRCELDDLARRLHTGACEIEDFALVRDVQAQAQAQAAAPSTAWA
ncbi:Voltage gated chloride channel domain-containing protein [Rhodotorula toruloides ATCC 204091]|uniref:BY PROTMAP: gi/342321378/gb/EGU13312.1/ Voltage gated chloride channel domain-containing protein [Rhodotorula glutinis ATCC 204091] n=1 Tax=Rhodotorula toruloides TaxID=5286 RepID=A0A0K3CP34_RHOTO|nr:Voltage gated chloride channel domain-containing protein [Rhodotorula toruloides ATCC 204091]KAK4332250.1 Voltage gated chloride channel domain-containing protein [Rhodotorula toruloides]PRQ72517.1 hypothetical protein AAT19DRAFT_16441 [Rhodotorula toruloides]